MLIYLLSIWAYSLVSERSSVCCRLQKWPQLLIPVTQIHLPASSVSIDVSHGFVQISIEAKWNVPSIAHPNQLAAHLDDAVRYHANCRPECYNIIQMTTRQLIFYCFNSICQRYSFESNSGTFWGTIGEQTLFQLECDWSHAAYELNKLSFAQLILDELVGQFAKNRHWSACTQPAR